ncbi:MAG: hypothetical protein ABFD86_09850 [Bryobacteraceae bacterium]
MCDSGEQMLAGRTKLDAVAIFSGAPDHYRYVEMCMERGLHTISAVPAVDVYEALPMRVPGIVAHRSSLKSGDQLKVPQFDKRA